MPQGHGYLRRLTQPFDGAIIPQSTAKAPADEAGYASLWLDGGVLCKLLGAHPAALKYRKFVGRSVYPNPLVGWPMKSSSSNTVDLMVNVVPLPLSSPNQRSVLFEAIDAALASCAAGYALQASKLFVGQRRTHHALRNLALALLPVMFFPQAAYTGQGRWQSASIKLVRILFQFYLCWVEVCSFIAVFVKPPSRCYTEGSRHAALGHARLLYQCFRYFELDDVSAR
ncbi:hypothetical protein [Pseudomonas synxantha]|uniref:hypothetical protein n=1 Tax=Pseudomonas synxantha TaxID=47883 RepID=UPI000AD31CD9|nr:hypothetical protein [Pseudomonas synxantha]